MSLTKMRRVREGLVFLLLVPATSFPQGAAPPSPPQTAVRQVPLSHLYSHFLVYEAHLQQMEQLHPEAMKSKKTFEDILREKTGLTEHEWKVVRASSTRFDAVHQSMLVERNSILRANCASAPSSCSGAKVALTALQTQHDQALQDEISSIESSLSAQSLTALHMFLNTKIRPTIRIITAEQAAAATQSVRPVSK